MDFSVIFFFILSFTSSIIFSPLPNALGKSKLQNFARQRRKGQVDLGVSRGLDKKSPPGVPRRPLPQSLFAPLLVGFPRVAALRLVYLTVTSVAQCLEVAPAVCQTLTLLVVPSALHWCYVVDASGRLHHAPLLALFAQWMLPEPFVPQSPPPHRVHQLHI